MASKENNGQIPTEVFEDIVKLVKSVNDMIQNFNSIKKPIIDTSNSVPEAAKQLDKVTQETEKATHKMLDLIEGILDREIETASMVETIFSEEEKLPDTAVKNLDRIKMNAEDSQNDSFMIMDSLQFQDITTQQIYHASAILGTIEERLQSLLSMIGEAFKMERSVKTHYDPEATTDNREGRQQSVDELIKATKKMSE
jgi:chemotaxis regulatin CheY-phosphate phosphatase CheZ